MNLALTSKIMTIQQIELDKSWEILRPKQDWIFVVEFLKKAFRDGEGVRPNRRVIFAYGIPLTLISVPLNWRDHPVEI